MPLDTTSFIFIYFVSCLHLYICNLPRYYWKGALHHKKSTKRGKVKQYITAKGCKKKKIQTRFLILDIQPNGLPGDCVLSQYIIAMKFNEEAGKVLCYICPRKVCLKKLHKLCLFKVI